MTIKLIALDLDGTLLSSDKSIDEATKKIIREAARKGMQMAFCTGRIASEMPEIISELPEVRYAVTSNGAYVDDLRLGKTIHKDLIDMDSIRIIYDRLKEFDMMFELCADGAVLADSSCLIDVCRYGVGYIEDLILRSRTGIGSMASYVAQRSEPVGKVNIFFPNNLLRDRALEITCGLPFEITHQEPTNLEFNKLGINKAKGLARLAGYLEATPAEVMAIGDNNNDIAMLGYAGISVAMSNATEEVKSAAGYVTKSNDENGVGWAIKKLAFEDTV